MQTCRGGQVGNTGVMRIVKGRAGSEIAGDSQQNVIQLFL